MIDESTNGCYRVLSGEETCENGSGRVAIEDVVEDDCGHVQKTDQKKLKKSKDWKGIRTTCRERRVSRRLCAVLAFCFNTWRQITPKFEKTTTFLILQTTMT